MSIYLPIFQALNKAEIRYIVVGGLATVLHGYGRLTADIVLIIDLNHVETEKALKVFISLGLKSRVPVNLLDFSDADTRKAWIAEKNMKVFSLWNPDNALISVDLFVEHPIEFAGMWSRAEVIDLGGTTIRIAAIPDLIALKKLANRPQDLDDIRKLEEILKFRK